MTSRASCCVSCMSCGWIHVVLSSKLCAFLSLSPVMSTIMCLCTDWLPSLLLLLLLSILHAELLSAWHLFFLPSKHLILSLVWQCINTLFHTWQPWDNTVQNNYHKWREVITFSLDLAHFIARTESSVPFNKRENHISDLTTWVNAYCCHVLFTCLSSVSWIVYHCSSWTSLYCHRKAGLHHVSLWVIMCCLTNDLKI